MHCKILFTCIICIVSYCGELQPVGCDNVLESGAQIDSCGICNGHDKSATRVSNTLTGTGGFGYHTVTVIPAGARNVRIAEATATSYVYLGTSVMSNLIMLIYLMEAYLADFNFKY